MTLPSTPRRAGPFNGNGSATSFSFTFKVFSDEDISVVRTSTVGIETPLTLDSDYSVTLNGDQEANPGGTVTYPISGTALATGEKLTIAGAIEYDQPTDIPDGGNFSPTALENALDRIEMQIQQLDEGLGRSIQLPVSVSGVESQLPVPEANHILAWNGTATGLVNQEVPLSTDTIDAANVLYTADKTGAVQRTGLSKFDDLTSVVDFGAVGDRSTANLTVVNQAITTAAAETDGLYLPPGDFVVAAQPTNPTGVPIRGPGRLLTPEAVGGFRQWNTYADDHHILVGREYLFRVYARLLLGPAGSVANLKIYAYGDSTVEGFVFGTSFNGNYLVENLIPAMLQAQGIPAIRKADDAVNATVINRGVSGTSWADLNAIPDLGSATDLLIIKYGINDGALLPGQSVAARIANMATAMRAKLAAIRAAANGGMGQCTILLVGPNSTNDSGHGRNEEWYERVRQVYVQAARDYQCAFFDTYAYLKDARFSAGLWMDNPTPGATGDPLYSANSSVHPLETMNLWIWGGVVDHVFARSQVSYQATNAFISIGSNTGYTPDATTSTPNTYRFGETWELGLAADSYPVDGLLKSSRNPDTYAFQELIPLAATGRTYRRYAASGSTWNTFWTGVAVALPGSNSWASFGGSAALATAVRDSSGVVTVEGVIKDGTTTAGTVMVTLPSGYRPVADQYFVVASSTTTPVRVKVAANGEITCDSTGDATMTSLGGITFRAA